MDVQVNLLEVFPVDIDGEAAEFAGISGLHAGQVQGRHCVAASIRGRVHFVPEEGHRVFSSLDRRPENEPVSTYDLA